MIEYYCENLNNYLSEIESFTYFCNGKKFEVEQNNEQFKIILEKLAVMIKSARILPAFGVSLHNETLNALNQGNWLQINFQQQQTINGLPFKSLLFELEVSGGVNLIRLNELYEGRCIYLDFEKPINLYKIVEGFI